MHLIKTGLIAGDVVLLETPAPHRASKAEIFVGLVMDNLSQAGLSARTYL